MCMCLLILTFIGLVLYSGALTALIEFALLSLIGHLLIMLFVKKENRNDSLLIFYYLMFAYGIYCILGYIYCINYGLEYIGSKDGIEYYLPRTLILLENDSFGDMFYESITDRNTYRYGGIFFLYLALFAKLSMLIDLDFCLAIRFSLIIFSSLICVVEYHIFLSQKFSSKDAFKWSIYFGLFSSIIWLSSYIVRDMPIALMFAVISYWILSEKANWLIFGCCIVFILTISSIRLASGFAAIPFLALGIFFKTRNKIIRTLSVICMLAIIVSSGFLDIIRDESITISTTYSAIEQRDQGGDSTLSAFNILPFGISHFAKLIYAQFHPFPAWKNMIYQDNYTRMFYNILRIPDIWTVFFRIVGLSVLLYGIIDMNSRRLLTKNKMLLSLFLYSFLLLLMQTSTISERRKIIVYPILYMVIFLFYHSFSKDARKNVLLAALAGFLSLQTIALAKFFFL